MDTDPLFEAARVILIESAEDVARDLREVNTRQPKAVEAPCL